MSLFSSTAQRLSAQLLLIIGLGLALATGKAGAATEVAGIRHWSGADHTRVVLDLNAAPAFEQKTTADPPRVVVDLSGTRFSQGVRPFRIRDGLVEEVRIISPPRGPAQLILELKRPAPIKIFTLGPGGGKPHRLVIDVFRRGETTSAAAKGASSSVAKSPPPRRDWVVVVDPGHGGRDPGAKGVGGVWEKDICLAIGRAVAADLDRRPGIKAYLTRDRDVYLSLRRRTRVAAEKQADIFLSIHTNSNHDRKARGTEVYFLSLRGASDEAAREVALRENAADHVEGVPTESQNEIEDILVDLMRTAALERSSDLAATVISHLRSDENLVLRGVKQAGFDVLKTAGMPSILVETAFISHATEGKLLNNKRFQQRFATLVGSGVASYLDRAAAAAEAPAASQAPAAAGRGGAAATSGGAGS